ncbi:putative yir1 protein [Plasmodium yoelii yoelii]|uniref:Yir1 protein n=1 Tax=Plasmodium yoelii yoelii TaxID=73239 RepID=Q7RST5_PLAYO|nr:putative yir1 protein [Plasmodium yoelii yoelii]
MDYLLCLRFDKLRNYFPDELNKSTKNDIHSLGNIKNYCSNGESEETGCKTDLDKINGGCLWLFEQNIVNRINDLSNEQLKVFIIYIIIWLNYMVNLKKDGEIKNLNDFYTKYIETNTHYTNCKKNNNDYNHTLKEKTGYNNFKEIIDKRKDFVNINFEYIPKFYDAFKSLCNMYTEIDANSPNCTKYLIDAKNFVEKYEKLNDDSISGDSSYRQILSTLSTDYDNFKNYCISNGVNCKGFPPLSLIKKKQNSELSEKISDVTSSSSSIKNKLIPVLSIIAAIPILLGIFYKVNNKELKNHFRDYLYAIIQKYIICLPFLY